MEQLSFSVFKDVRLSSARRVPTPNDPTSCRAYEQFKDRSSQHDLTYLKKVISRDLEAREIRDGEVTDYSYQESIEGWKQAFDHFAGMDMEWKYTDHSITKLKDDEWLASFYLSPVIEGEEAAPHLYFNIFKLINNQWQLVRSYIETGVASPTSS